MSDRDDDNSHKQDADKQQNSWDQNENLFSDFQEEADFEDSDRDSDFAAIYSEAEGEEDPEPEDTVEFESGTEETWELEEEGADEIEPNDPWETSISEEDDLEQTEETDLWDSSPEQDIEEDSAAALGATTAFASATSEADEDPEDWDDLEDDYEAEESRELTISLGMVIVAVFALVLLGAGGYGVIEQRAEMQEEIRQLQARLATSAAPNEVAASRTATAQTNLLNVELQQQVDNLIKENSSLQAIVTGLEKQLSAQQEALQKKPAPVPSKPAPTPAPKPAAQPIAEPKADTTGNNQPVATGWFVNFSSYTLRSTADSWVKKLKPAQGRVIVSEGQSKGKTIYRVRVVDLQDRAAADAIARSLEKEYGLPKLWVGKSS